MAAASALFIIHCAVGLAISGVVANLATCPIGCICDFSENTVTCSDIESPFLASFLSSIPENTESLRVVGARFTASAAVVSSDKDPEALPQYDTSLLISLKNLTLHNIEMKNADWSVLGTLTNLQELNLDYNNMTNFFPPGFPALQNLETLSMRHNKFNFFNRTAIPPFGSLRLLNISHNGFTSVPNRAFEKMPSLEEMDLSDNSLKSLAPGSLNGLAQLRIINLERNNLKEFQNEVILNLTSLSSLRLRDNPWSCTCALEWLRAALQPPNPIPYVPESSVLCQKPENLRSRPLVDVAEEDLECTSPEFDTTFDDHSILYLETYLIRCNATGDPAPSIFWRTPWGVLAHHDHLQWIPSEEGDVHSMIKYAGQPTHYEASLTALRDGSLSFHNYRGFYAGVYTCVAKNVAGFVNETITIQSASNMPHIEHICLIYGAVVATGFLILSLIMASIRLCIVHVCFKKRFKHLPSGITMEITDQEEEDLARISPHLFRWTPYHFDPGSPDFSPAICVTPAEEDDAEQNFSEMSSGILETLEDVRLTLRMGMGRQVDRIRNRAHNVRQSSSRYVQNFRASSSNYMHSLRETGSKKLGSIRETSSKKVRSIRESSSHFANRVRAGVVLGTEQVKYHVQSMKELCGTGEMAHTISTISVSTDVDSRERREVVRTVTYV